MEMKEYRNLPLWNSGLTIEQRLDYLMEELTREEKLQCLGTGCPAIERLGIPSFYVGGEGAHGVQARHDQSFDRGAPQPTTIFPNPIGMSSTWDTELLRDVGCAVGNEARAVFEKEGKGGLCLWAPTVDMERDPRWGRTEEAYGEDPFLAGKMAAAYVRGLRGEDSFYIRCAATLKHFYANNVEEGRVWKSSSIDPRNRFEYYLEPFHRAVTEGGAEGIMTAYNEVDGTPCLLLEEMQKRAKDMWGVHHIVCDGGDMMQTVQHHRYFASHTETVAAALKAGMDCFTDDLDVVMESAEEALARGMITMDDIDRALRCHFGTMIRLGLFDALPKNPYASAGRGALNCRKHQELARRVTAESVVLLQNRETETGKLLPLGREKSLAVIGPWTDLWLMDWYSGVPPYHVTPLEGILAELAGSAVCETAQSGQETGSAMCETSRGDEKAESAVCKTAHSGEEDGSAVYETARSIEKAGSAMCEISQSGKEAESAVCETAQSSEEAGSAVCETAQSDKKATDAMCDIASEVKTESGMPQIQLCCGERYLGILEADGTVGLVDQEHAETFEAILWDDRQLTLRAMSNGRLLSVEDGKDEQENYRRGVVAATKEEAFGWFVKEAFQVRWEGDSFYQALLHGEELFLHSWNDTEFFADEANRLRVCENGSFVEDGKPVPVKAETSMETSFVYTQTGRRYERLSRFRAVMKRDSLRKAAEMAAGVDVVLVLAGAHPMITCKEERDRRDIEFPPYQRELIQAVSKANPQVVLVLISSVPFAVRWEKEHIPAILTMATGSMELGRGLADVLFGNVPPAGRLNMTWYCDSKQLPDMNHYDIIQEERTYQYFRGEVLYPFGHGLTYSTFNYSGLQVELWDRASLRICLDIRNTGKCVSDEVVQIYVSKEGSCVKRPLRQLKGFQRIREIAPGQGRHVEFVIPLDELQYFDVVEEQMLLEPGGYEIQAGCSSQDIRLRKSIVLDGTPRGVRDALRKNPAEYYDRSRHACRTEGHMGYIGIVPDVVSGTAAAAGEISRRPEAMDVEAANATAGEIPRRPEAMVLEYERVSFSKTVDSLVLDACVRKGAEIAVFWNGQQIGHYTEGKAEPDGGGAPVSGIRQRRSFAEIVIPLTEEGRSLCRPDEESIDTEESGVLKFVCTGDVALCRWWFTGAL